MKYALSTMLLALLCMGMMSSCDTVPHRPTLSSAFLKFNPQQQFTTIGCTVDQGPSEGRISPQEGYGWRPIQGAVELPANAEGCEFVARAVRDALVGIVAENCKDELTMQDDRGRGQPTYGLLRYTNEGMQGVVYVWLFPDEAEKRIKFAILLHEERPRNDS